MISNPVEKGIRCGIRGQAAVIIAVSALWWLSMRFGLMDHASGLPRKIPDGISFFIDGCFPFFAALLTFQLLISHLRYVDSPRPHRWWVRLAVVASMSVWLRFLPAIIHFLTSFRGFVPFLK
jgi:hypothetical protein